MVDFNLLEGPAGRKFLHIHTDKTTYIVEITDKELSELSRRLTEPPAPVKPDVNNDDDE